MMESSRERFPSSRNQGSLDYADQTLGADRAAIFLYINQGTDYSDQIAALETAGDSTVFDVAIHVVQEESIGPFAQKFSIKGSPTYLLFISGVEKGRLLGKSNHGNLVAFINKHMSGEQSTDRKK